MPLVKGKKAKTKKGMSANIRKEVAIAYSVAKKSKKKKK